MPLKYQPVYRNCPPNGLLLELTAMLTEMLTASCPQLLVLRVLPDGLRGGCARARGTLPVEPTTRGHTPTRVNPV
jgi:hypothetical protein